MPNCAECGASTTIARIKGTDQKVTLDATVTRLKGPGRYRLVEFDQVPPIAQRVSETFEGREMVEHSQVCSQPLTG